MSDATQKKRDGLMSEAVRKKENGGMMNNANVLKRCCYRSLKENRKRTAVTIVGIILATALITGVACLAVSLRSSMIASEKQQLGDYHYRFVQVKQEYLKYFENNTYIEKCGLLETIGYAPLEGSQNPDKPYLYISAIEEGMEGMLALKLVEGRMPENDTELVVGRHVRSNGAVDVRVGDVLTLQMGERASAGDSLGQENPYHAEEESFEPAFEKTYTVVGIIERPNQDLEPRIAPGYSAFTLLEDPGAAEAVDIYVSYTKKGLRRAEAVNAGLLGVEEELYHRYAETRNLYFTQQEEEQFQKVAKSVQENYWVLKWELMIFSDSMTNVLYAMSAIAILIIIVTSVFCIHNGFMISLTEKMKLYGRLASIGMTARQLRKMVYYEAALLGLVGIPLGVLSGIGASAILVKVVCGLVEEALGFELQFGISVPAVFIGAVLSAATVYFSASGSAKRAARISPISAIRANEGVKTDWDVFGKKLQKELRCPAFVNELFGIGGKIAYKNLRRARVKYRTTVVSIVVSVAVFIGMSTFVELMMLASDVYAEGISYQIKASIYPWKFYSQAMEIARLDGVQEAEIVRSVRFPMDREISYNEDYLKEFQASGQPAAMIRSLGQEAYERYCQKVGVSVAEAKDKAIVLADYEWEAWNDGKLYSDEGEITHLKPGQILKGIDAAEGVEIEVLVQTDVKPMYLGNNAANQITLIVSDEWLDAQTGLEGAYDNVDVFIRCEDADAIEETIRNNMLLQHYTVINYDAVIRSDRSFHLVTAIFLYGFITVVALIGITNIFNTITTNMELRAPEFAMLRSVGMTGREFQRMIWLEGVFYGGKALLIGIPIGVFFSICFNLALGQGIVTAFRFPWMGTLSAAAAVGLLLFAIMHYSMGKINRKNIIETIRNENI